MFLAYILPVFLLTYRNGRAAPIHPTPYSNATSPPTILAAIEPTSQPPRSPFGVVWSCLLTVFICAWTSVHPNVPPQRFMGGLIARLKLMFWTIVAPELVLAWAVRQWFSARKIRDTFNNSFRSGQHSKRWTMTHGHLLAMGGFRLVDEESKKIQEPCLPGWLSTSDEWTCYDEYRRQMEAIQGDLGPLTLERFTELVQDPEVEFPAITRAEIQDRSKGDGLTKVIAILQTSWFIVQCIARGFQDLALTELELVTLAMASLNAITFVFWWSKPLSVQEPVNVYVLRVAKGEVRLREPECDDVNIRTSDILEYLSLISGALVLPVGLLINLTLPFFALFPFGALFLGWIIKPWNTERPHGNIATRIVLTLHRSHYRLMHFIRQRIARLLKRYEGLAFPMAMDLYFVIPAGFSFLFLILVTLTLVKAVFFIASCAFPAVFEVARHQEHEEDGHADNDTTTRDYTRYYLIRVARQPYAFFFNLTSPIFALFPIGTLLLLWIIKAKNAEKPHGNVATRIVLTLLRLRYRLTHAIRQTVARPLQNISDMNKYKEIPFIMNWFFIVPISFIFLVLILVILSPLFTIFFIASFTFTAVFEIITTDTVPPDATHVPPFYAPRTDSDPYTRMVIFAIFGLIFGGIHCIAWNFTFPTNPERFSWRYTSIMLTAIPLVAAPIDWILENIKFDGKFNKKLRLTLDIFMTALLFVYVPARISLIAQALALLRQQPPTAWVAVDWTKYIPHLFN